MKKDVRAFVLSLESALDLIKKVLKVLVKKGHSMKITKHGRQWELRLLAISNKQMQTIIHGFCLREGEYSQKGNDFILHPAGLQKLLSCASPYRIMKCFEYRDQVILFADTELDTEMRPVLDQFISVECAAIYTDEIPESETAYLSKEKLQELFQMPIQYFFRDDDGLWIASIEAYKIEAFKMLEGIQKQTHRFTEGFFIDKHQLVDIIHSFVRDLTGKSVDLEYYYNQDCEEAELKISNSVFYDDLDANDLRRIETVLDHAIWMVGGTVFLEELEICKIINMTCDVKPLSSTYGSRKGIWFS